MAKTLLKTVARLIEQSVGESDFVARCRDDAFAVVMPQAGFDEAEAFCGRVREAATARSQLDIKPRISAVPFRPSPAKTRHNCSAARRPSRFSGASTNYGERAPWPRLRGHAAVFAGRHAHDKRGHGTQHAADQAAVF